MPRPAGKYLSPGAFSDLLLIRGLTKARVAEMAEISLSTLSGLAANKHAASDRIIRALCDALAVNDSTLFPEVGRYRYVHPGEQSAAA